MALITYTHFLTGNFNNKPITSTFVIGEGAYFDSRWEITGSTTYRNANYVVDFKVKVLQPEKFAVDVKYQVWLSFSNLTAYLSTGELYDGSFSLKRNVDSSSGPFALKFTLSFPFQQTKEIVIMKNHFQAFTKAVLGNSKDIKIKVGDTTFEAHKQLLAVSSGFFETLFEGEWKESASNIVELKEMSSPVFELVMKFLYDGEIGDIKSDSDTVLLLIKAADFLQMKNLGELACEYLGDTSLEGKEIEYALIGHRFGNQTLIAKSTGLIAHNHLSFINTPEWSEVAKCPEILMEVLQRVPRNINC